VNKLTQKFLVVSLLGLSSCYGEAQSGRLVGFIVDGQSGQRLNFFKADGDKQNVGDDGESTSQVYAVIDGEFRRAKPCGRGDLTNTNAIVADGCFQIDGIPEGMTIPLFAEAPGYERFIGQYTYSQVDSDIERSQEVANIRLFPKGFAVDYRFNVSYANQPVQDAKVICQYLQTSNNSLQVSGEFLTPKNTGSASVTASSNVDGVATIPGAQLVNGATYACEAVLSQTSETRTLSGQGSFVAGVSQSEQNLALSASGSTDTVLYAVRSNVDDPNVLVGVNGKLVVTFNRPVEIVSGTADCQVAFATTFDVDADGRTGRLITDVRNNPPTTYSTSSESVTADISSDGYTLTLGFRVEPGFEFDPDDRGTTVTFGGVVLRPRGTTDSNVRYIGALGSCPAVNNYNVAQVRSLRAPSFQNSTIKLF
jgi:hypothetical protein